LIDTAYDAELRIPSDLIYLRSVRAFIREMAENIGFSQDKVSNIELATDEVFTNAVQHGSADSSSKITVYCSLTDEAMKIVVSDLGQEGNRKWLEVWSDVVEKRIQFGTERGHGLLLAYSLADEMRMESNLSGGVDVHLVWLYGEG